MAATTIVVSDQSDIGSFSSEISTNLVNKGSFDSRVANALFALQTAANAEVGSLRQVNQEPVDPQSGMLADGTPLAAWADNASSNPGITLADSKAKAVRWNNNASQTAVWYSVPLPQDLDDATTISVHGLVSKSGATLADAVKLTVAAFFVAPGAAHDADADCGGDSNALTGDAAAKTVTELIRTIAAVDVHAAPCVLSFSVKPKDGTLGTDDAILSGLWVEFEKKTV